MSSRRVDGVRGGTLCTAAKAAAVSLVSAPRDVAIRCASGRRATAGRVICETCCRIDANAPKTSSGSALLASGINTLEAMLVGSRPSPGTGHIELKTSALTGCRPAKAQVRCYLCAVAFLSLRRPHQLRINQNTALRKTAGRSTARSYCARTARIQPIQPPAK